MTIVKTKPCLVFTQKAMQKMKSFTLAGHKERSEVSMLGVSASDDFLEDYNRSRHKTVDVLILDFFPVNQEGNSVFTEMDDEAVLIKRDELVELGHARRYQNVHFHSHPQMSTTPSGTDEGHIEEYEPDVLLVTVIMNEKYALTEERSGINVRMDIWYPFRRTFKDGEVDFSVEKIQVIPDDWGKKAFSEFVTERVRTVKKLSLTPGHGRKTLGNAHHYLGNGYGLSQQAQWTQTGYRWQQSASLDLEEDLSGKVVPCEEPPDGPYDNINYRTFSHPELQDAYDDNLINEETALALEHKFLTDEDFVEVDLLEEVDEEIEKGIKLAANDPRRVTPRG